MGNPEFLVKGAQFIATHPDFLEKLDKLHRDKFDMDPAAREEIEQLAMPEIPYWLADEGHSDDRNNLNNLKGKAEESREYIRQLAARVERQGYGQDLSTEDYLSARHEAARAGLSFAEHLTARGAGESLSGTDRYILERKLEKRGRR